MSGFRYGTSALRGGLIAFALAIGWSAPMKAAEGDLKLLRATLSRSLDIDAQLLAHGLLAQILGELLRTN